MSEPTNQPGGTQASIRTYVHEKDFKFIRYLIGASILSRTGPANVHLFWSNPLVYLWLFGFTAYIPFIETDSNREGGIDAIKAIGVKVLIRMPVFVGPPLILLVLLSWCHRRHFNSVMRQALGSEDMRHPPSYYTGTAGEEETSGIPSMYVLDYEGRQLGVVAVDKDREEFESVKPVAIGDDDQLAEKLVAQPAGLTPDSTLHNPTIWIRHLATSIPFRPAGIDLELVSYAVSRCLKNDDTVERIVISLIPVLDDVQIKAVETIGFKRTISAQAPSGSYSMRLRAYILRMIGWPNCEEQWKEEIWVLERSQFTAYSGSD